MTSVALLHLDMSCNLILVTFELETRTTANFVQSWTKDIKKVKWYFFSIQTHYLQAQHGQRVSN